MNLSAAKKLLSNIKITDSLEGIHVTSDPNPVYDVLMHKKDISGSRGEGKVGDLGSSGLYFSEYPQLWSNRAYKKWETFKDLPPEKQEALHGKLKDDIYKQRNAKYITETEKDYALRSVDNFLNTGDIEHATALAGQPYNIPFWKQDYLSPLGIKQIAPPMELDVAAKGKFADLTGVQITDELVSTLKKEGFDGAYVKSSFSSVPQSVVWNTNAIKKFGDMKLPAAAAIGAGAALTGNNAYASQWKNFKSDEEGLQDAYNPLDMAIAAATGGATLTLKAAAAALDPIIDTISRQIFGE